MKFHKYFNKSALHVAAEIGNAEIVNLLLSRPEINVNIISIWVIDFNKISKTFDFNDIYKNWFQFYFKIKSFNNISKTCISIQFQIFYFNHI